MGFSRVSSIAWSQSGRWARSSWGDEWARIQARWVTDLEVACGRACSVEFLKSIRLRSFWLQCFNWLRDYPEGNLIQIYSHFPTLQLYFVLYYMACTLHSPSFFRFSDPFTTECSTISMRKREGNRKRQWGREANSGRKETTDKRQKRKDESSLLKTGWVKQTWCPFSASVPLFLPW